MLMPGVFAVIGLLLLAGHLARPDLLRRIVHADTQLLRIVPWFPRDQLEIDGLYQRAYRSAVVGTLVAWVVVNVLVFAASYVPGLM